MDAKHITDKRHFRKENKVSYAEVLGAGKYINSTKFEITATKTPKKTQNEGAIDLAAIRSALLT